VLALYPRIVGEPVVDLGFAVRLDDHERTHPPVLGSRERAERELKPSKRAA
jgi:hypothetical protein